jgi:phage minor structural protein
VIRVFSDTDKIYTSNGDAVINATKARVHNSDNGDYYLELTCGSEYSQYIIPNNILVVPTPDGAQGFRIRSVSKMSKKLEVKAWHVFYDGLNYLIADSYAVNLTCQQALDHFNAATDTLSPFTMSSNIQTLNTYRCVRTSLTECIYTVIERWGGHLVRDNWNIGVKASIGVDNGITIQYRKNLKELKASYDWSNVVTKLMPVGKDGILLDERYVLSDRQYNIPFTKAVSFEQDINAEDYPDEQSYINALKQDLYAQAVNYLEAYSLPQVNYSLKGNPEKLSNIGDMIKVLDERINVDIYTRVIAYEYDAIAERYVNLEFGNFAPSLGDLMSDITKNTNIQISNATSKINIEVNTIMDAINTLSEAVQGKQDALSAGDGIKLSNNRVSLDTLGSYTHRSNIIAEVDSNVAVVRVILPRPIGQYQIDSFVLELFPQYGSNTSLQITNETADITYTSEKLNDYTLKVTITDAGSSLTGLSGAYNSYLMLEIAPQS